jgi:hypothetical protein
MYFGRDAGRRAYLALSFRAFGLSMWVFAGLWAVACLGFTVQSLVGADEYDWLLTTRWWVLVLLTPVWALCGALGYRLFHVWERKALGDRYPEVRLRPRPDVG